MTEKNAKPRGKIKSHGHADLPVLPSKWCWATINDLAAAEPNSITDGPFGSNLKTSHYTETGPRVIRLQNIGDGIFHDATAHISESHFSRLKKHEVVAGDLVIAALGETLPRSCVMPPWVGPAIVKADCPRFRANRSIVLPEFVNYALNSPDTQRRTSEIIHGVGRPRLNLSEVRGIWIPTAPINEQRRIVSKIEELFSDLDAGVAALKRAKANLKRYRAAVLKSAVEGKLTEEWRAKHPHAEPASKLLARILTERRQKWESEQLAKFAGAGKEPPKGWKEKYVEPTPPDTTDLPELPEDWCWVSLDQTCDIGTGTTPSRSNPAFYSGGTIPWVMSSAVNRSFVDEASEFVTEHAIRETTLRLYPAGTLIIALYGEGKTRGTVSELRIAATVNQAIGTLGFAETGNLIRPFVKLFLASNYDQLRRQAAGGMQPNLNLGILKQIAVPIPPLNEQTPIVAEVAMVLSQIEAAETAIDQDLLRAGRLRQSVLKQAFAGKLVPQDPNDEPASVMLDKLHGGQTEEAPKKQRRTRQSPNV